MSRRGLVTAQERSAGLSACWPTKGARKRVCFTSKHSFARIVPSRASLSSTISLSLLSIRLSNEEHTLQTRPRVLPGTRSRVYDEEWPAFHFPTPLGQQAARTNRTSPRVKTLDWQRARGHVQRDASRTARGGWVKNR